MDGEGGEEGEGSNLFVVVGKCCVDLGEAVNAMQCCSARARAAKFA